MINSFTQCLAENKIVEHFRLFKCTELDLFHSTRLRFTPLQYLPNAIFLSKNNETFYSLQ